MAENNQERKDRERQEDFDELSDTCTIINSHRETASLPGIRKEKLLILRA